jgi:hypothetical protein
LAIQIAIKVLVALYLVLLGLNYFWFHKMVKGALKHMAKQKKSTESDVTS